MLIGVGLDARLGLPFAQLRAAAREAQPLGFESLWTPAGGVPDSFHVCAAWSQDTSLRTGIAVVPAARMWSPLGLAAQAATLAQLSSGRFVLGLGTGGYGPGFWASVGLPNRPIAVMREYVTQVRALLAGETVTAGKTAVGGGTPGWPRSASLGVADPRRLRCTWPRSARRCSGSQAKPLTVRCSTGRRPSTSRSAGPGSARSPYSASADSRRAPRRLGQWPKARSGKIAKNLIIRVIVPRKVIVPSLSRRPRSVVCHQPPRKRSELISGRFQ